MGGDIFNHTSGAALGVAMSVGSSFGWSAIIGRTAMKFGTDVRLICVILWFIYKIPAKLMTFPSASAVLCA